MRHGAPLSWLESKGWLVLSGSADPLSEIRAQALSRHNAGGAIAYISFADDEGDALMDDMAELGAATGYLVDLTERDNNEVYERLTAAGMIVIEANEPSDGLMPLITQTALHAMKDALSRGALILFEGSAAGITGEYILTSDRQTRSGLNLVHNAAISPGVSSIMEDGAAREFHLDMPEAVVIGLERGSALALGPDHEIETWGEGQVTISLGEGAGRAEYYESDEAIK